MKYLRQHLAQYFAGFKQHPSISAEEGQMLAEEIARMVEILEESPNISYSDLWDRIHEID